MGLVRVTRKLSAGFLESEVRHLRFERIVDTLANEVDAEDQ
jgi:hypothetical protein